MPTSTPNPPSPTLLPAAVRIDFAPGATAGVEQGEIQPGQAQDFVLTASQAQPMIAMVDSPNYDATIAIQGGQNGAYLLDPSQKWTSWEGTLPATQDYLIRVIGGSSSEAFTLTVIIPGRITFPQGATSVTENGSTPGGLVVSYVLYALTGQRMTVSLNAPAASAALVIYGFEDGQPLVRLNLNATTWSGTLPATEDYLVQIDPISGQDVNYTITVNVN